MDAARPALMVMGNYGGNIYRNYEWQACKLIKGFALPWIRLMTVRVTLAKP